MNDVADSGWDARSEPFLVGDFEVDAATHCISKDGVSSRLEPRAMALLLYLAHRPGSVATREELEREVWRGMVVGYDALNNTVAKLRKAFNDDPKHPRVIQTIPKVGYRLIAEVGVSPLPIGIVDESASDPSLERKLTAIFYADVVDYSRLTGLDEEGTHLSLRSCLDLVTSLIDQYHGKVVHFAGDAILAEFATATNALSCAATVQRALAARHEGVADDRKMQFRIGVNLGEVIVDRVEIYGDGVNVAARLESLAEPGGICLSGTVFDAIGHKLPLEFSFLGERRVKNIEKPVRAYQARLKPGTSLPPPTQKQSVTTNDGGESNKARWAMTASILAVAAIAVLFWVQPWRQDAADTGASATAARQDLSPSLAVLPFENMSDDPAQEFYADGMTGDLITDLSKLSGLTVIARHSVFAYKGKPTELEQIAKELSVRYLLEGNVRRFDGNIRINVSLIDAGSSRSIWSERYDGDENELFDLHNRVIANVVSALAVELTDQEQTVLARSPTESLEAYDYYLRAERRRLVAEAYSADEMAYHGQEAIELYWKAIALDPDFAQAYAGLALIGFDVWSADSTHVMPSAAARKLAYDSASKVRELDPKNPAAYSVLALLQVTDGQAEIALESSRRATELGPNNADAWAIRAQVMMYAGRHEEALKAISRAFDLNPKPAEELYGLLGRAQFFNEMYDEAAVSLSKVGANNLRFRHELLMTYGQLDSAEPSKRVLEGIVGRMPFTNLGYYRARYAHYRDEDVEKMLEGLRKAGVPENAYGFRGKKEDRLDSNSLKGLLEKTWRGSDNTGMRFVQQISGDSNIAFRSESSLLVGTAWIENDMFCARFRTSLLGRKDCGYVYHNRGGTQNDRNEYIRTALGQIYYFSAE